MGFRVLGRYRLTAGALAATVAMLAAGACATAPSNTATIDVLDYVIGAPDTWPRFGPTNHHQHQNLESDRACWTKYTLGWSYECWRWDDDYVYHAVDHAIDGARRWEFYVFSDGRWMPRRLRDGETWTLEILDNRLESAREIAAGLVAPQRVGVTGFDHQESAVGRHVVVAPGISYLAGQLAPQPDTP